MTVSELESLDASLVTDTELVLGVGFEEELVAPASVEEVVLDPDDDVHFVQFPFDAIHMRRTHIETEKIASGWREHLQKISIPRFVGLSTYSSRRS
jgi:hypothetical protein